MTNALTGKEIDYLAIVRAATLAPSVENTQPWSFKVDGDGLTIYLDGNRSLESDVDCMLDFTSVGACIENAVIAFRQTGTEPRLTDLWGSRPLKSASRLLPVVRLEPGQLCEADHLFASIPSRTTCRRLDHKQPLPASLLSQLSDVIRPFPAVKVDWITESMQMATIARLVGAGNRIRFEHEPFHAEFYHNLRLTPEEARRSCDGLDLDTLQLTPAARITLRLMRSWGRIRIANALGFSRAIERQARSETLASAALGVLTVDLPSAVKFLDGGRALERIWLTASAAGVGLHPAASPAVFLGHADRTDGSKLLPAHLRTAREMNRQFNVCLPSSQGRTLQMIFRLGYPSKSSRPSLRRPLRDSIESEVTLSGTQL